MKMNSIINYAPNNVKETNRLYRVTNRYEANEICLKNTEKKHLQEKMGFEEHQGLQKQGCEKYINNVLEKKKKQLKIMGKIANQRVLHKKRGPFNGYSILNGNINLQLDNLLNKMEPILPQMPYREVISNFKDLVKGNAVDKSQQEVTKQNECKRYVFSL